MLSLHSSCWFLSSLYSILYRTIQRTQDASSVSTSDKPFQFDMTENLRYGKHCVESITFPYDVRTSKYLSVAKRWKTIGAKIFYVDGDSLMEL